MYLPVKLRLLVSWCVLCILVTSRQQWMIFKRHQIRFLS